MRNVSTVPQIGGYMCGLYFDQYTCSYGSNALGDLYFGTHLYFLNYWDPYDPYEYEKRQYAWEWFVGALAMWDLDPAYCTYYTGTPYDCLGDSVVPYWSAQYPGAFADLIPNGPDHIHLTSNPGIYERIAAHLRPGGRLVIP